MSTNIQRFNRETVNLKGVIYLNEIDDILVKNISITGMLAELDQKKDGENDIRNIFNSLKASTIVDFFIPSKRMAGKAEVTRADVSQNKILLGLEFKSMLYNAEDFIFRGPPYPIHLDVCL